FVGARLKPKSYPLGDKSYILQNTSGVFKDVTREVAPALSDLGMVTSALWSDFDHDGVPDLIVVGEWMQITFLKNDKGKFVDITKSTATVGLTGFWNSINGADFDQDGDIDYIVGNFGENNDLKASETEPLKIVAKDFDNNGKIDPIIGYYVNGTSYPLATRDALISQIASMKKRFTFYKDYGETTFNDMFSEEELKGAIRKEATTLKSIYLENKGNGKFDQKELPFAAQIAPVYGISIADLDMDGALDVVLTGNRTDTETLGGSINSSIGTVLMGDGQGNFQSLPTNRSGFKASRDARGTAQLNSIEGVGFIIANNDSALQYFDIKEKGKLIPIKPLDSYAMIELQNGKTYRHEFYYGSGYLTQNSRAFRIPEKAVKITIFDTKGGSRNALE
ncbi:MAG: VCBS repeat-containing protein, partial [Leeuwenhoekiella sp.]